MSDPMADLRDAMMIINAARREVLCPPDLESRIKERVDALGLGGLIKVIADPACPEGKIFIISPQPLDEPR